MTASRRSQNLRGTPQFMLTGKLTKEPRIQIFEMNLATAAPVEIDPANGILASLSRFESRLRQSWLSEGGLSRCPR